MRILRITPLLFALSVIIAQSPLAMAQQPGAVDNSSSTAVSAPQRKSTGQPVPAYIRPTEKTKFHNYLFDTFGPYPFIGSAIAAGIGQSELDPPDWRQGADAFGKRFASSFGITAIATTTRYGLAEVLREDTLYYQCECKGIFRRLRHAAISTLTARHGDDGHRTFSVSALVSPYVGSMSAVYAWYPDRYSDQDAFRMGSYALLWSFGQNIATEFIYGGPHSLLSRTHLIGSNKSSH